jgi:monolysocardiolipin acyltransferase
MLPRFKWGAARLLLEAEPAPLVVPVFISGLATVMPEDRAAPRWLPRLGARVEVAFGDPADDRAMDAFRRRWKALRDKVGVGRSVGDGAGAAEVEAALPLEVRELRSEVAGWLREEVAKVRRARGWPEEDETWSGEKKDDGGLVGTT